MILNERQARQQLVEEAARQIMIAARTAPKGKGVDVIEVCMLTGEEICQLSDEMRLLPNAELQKYVENEILPKYQSFDAAHQVDHARMVIEQSLRLATTVSNSSRYVNEDGSKSLISTNMMYAIAAFHDLGLQEDRKTHHLVSGRIVREDKRLKEWFSAEQIETMAQAVENHRASSDHEPRSIYGKIVAEADRLIDQETILRRTLQYGFKHYPDFGKEAHIQRALDHLDEKYAEGGYLKLWIPESPNAERLHALQQLIKNRTEVRKLVEEIYEQEINNVKSRN